jgi:polysaccharide pyruvyl transferase CsaB
MSKALIVGNFGADNLGDELILQGMLVLCKELSLKPSVVSSRPKETKKIYNVFSYSRLPFGIRSFFSFSWVPTLRAFKKTDYVLLGGGGLFVDRFFAAPFIWGLHGLLAVLFRKPLFLLGHSFEVKRGFTKFILKFLCKKARVVVVRDKESLKLLSNLGIDKSKCFLFPDLSFFIQHKAKHNPKGKVIGLSLCRWGISKKGIGEIASFVKRHLRNGYDEIRFFVFQGGHDDDKKILNEIVSDLPSEKVKIVLHSDPDFINLYSQVSFILGMRLHSLLLAYLFRIPFTAIAYQDKVKNSLEDLGLSAYCFPVNKFSSDDLCSTMKRAINDKKFFVELSEIDEKFKELTKIISRNL